MSRLAFLASSLTVAAYAARFLALESEESLADSLAWQMATRLF